MFFTIEKFQRRAAELGERRYFGRESIAPFTSMRGDLEKDAVYHELPEKIEGTPFGINDMFVGRDGYLWLEKTVRLPKARAGCQVVGLFDFGTTAPGNGSGVEGLLYVDGQCYQGIDTNHQEVVFTEKEGQEVLLSFLLWTGLEGGGVPHDLYHRMKQADLGYLHKKTDELYYYAKAISETLRILKPEDENYRNLKAALERALLCIDWDREPEVFYPSVDRAWEVLMKELNGLEKHTDVTVHTVGHTHIDLAWLWRLKHTREKAQRSFSTVLHLMDQYSEFRFLQSQPQLYKFVKEDNPALYERIREKVKEGKWEPDGGMWVEADCNIPSGESLVRQFLYGTRFMEQEFGKKCEFLWLPDVFGYSWALPQILKQCEIRTFMTIKIGWNQYNTFPCDLFKWKGMDGTEVLTYFISTPDDWQPEEARSSTYNGVITPFTVNGCWRRFKNKDITKDVLLDHGYGDGGGAVNREMLEMRRVIDRLPGMPNVKPSTVGEFFRKIHENVEQTDQYVHTWDGELYFELHRGTYTSQSRTKKYNRKLEHMLKQTEFLASLQFAQSGVYPQKELHDSWESVLLHQFHDIIPGSSIHEVYEDAERCYQETEEKTKLVREGILGRLAADTENTYGIFSANSFGGTELVSVPEMRCGSFFDADGKQLEASKSGSGYDVRMEIRPFSVANIRFCPENGMQEEGGQTGMITVLENGVETPFYCVQWDENGDLTRLYDRQAKRSVLKEGGKGNVLEIFEDKPMDWDAWDIDIFHYQKRETMKLAEPVQLLEQNSQKAVFRFVYRYRHSEVVQDMTVYRDLRRIDFRTSVDWQEEHRLLKAAFDTDIRSTMANYDSQFGYVTRPTHWNQSWDWAKFEVCGHKWADLSEIGYGVSLLNDCKYGYSIKDATMRISLLKSARFPDPEADLGQHTFTYSLYPHMGNLTEGGTIAAANQLNDPAQAVKGSFADTRQLIRVDGEGIQIDAVKKAEDEDCLVVRMHECLGGRRKAAVYSDYPIKKMTACNMLEHDCADSGCEDAGSTADLEFRPFEIKNYKVYFS